MKKRILWIDIARGIAMLSVIVGHTLNVNGSIDRAIYLFHMPIFFILSGYLYRVEPLNISVKKETYNVLLPYLGTSLILIIMYPITYMSHMIFQYRYKSFLDVILSIIFGSGMPVKIFGKETSILPIGAIWFLLAFFIAELIFKYFIKMSKKNGWSVCTECLMMSLVVIIGITVSKYVTLPWSINSALIATIFIYVGYLMKKERVLENITNGLLIISGIICVFAYSNETFILAEPQASDFFVSIFGGIAASIIVVKISQLLEEKLKIMSGVLSFYGRTSLMVLCFHLIDINVLNESYWFLNYPSIFQKLLILLFRVTFVTVCVLLVPNIPFIRWIYSHHSIKLNKK